MIASVFGDLGIGLVELALVLVDRLLRGELRA